MQQRIWGVDGMYTMAYNTIDGSLNFSDAEDRSWCSPNKSNGVKPYDDSRMSSVSNLEIGAVSDPHRRSSVSECPVEWDLESGHPETKVHWSHY